MSARPIIELSDPHMVPVSELPAYLARLAALQNVATVRLLDAARGAGEADCECFDVDQVATLLCCSVDLVRQRGEVWGIAKVLARDSRGRPSRVVYPRALLRAYLCDRPGERK